MPASIRPAAIDPLRWFRKVSLARAISGHIQLTFRVKDVKTRNRNKDRRVDLLHFFRWLGSLPVAGALNDSEWLFPAIESVHITGLAVLIGTIAIVDFRLLGLTLQDRPVSELARNLKY